MFLDPDTRGMALLITCVVGVFLAVFGTAVLFGWRLSL